MIETMKKLWRPVLAFTLIAILLINYTILPFFDKSQALPAGYWSLTTTFLGIYAASRGYEKTKDKA